MGRPKSTARWCCPLPPSPPGGTRAALLAITLRTLGGSPQTWLLSTNSFFPDGCDNTHGEKPWKNNEPFAPKKFWEGYNDWSKTWDFKGEGSALQIRNLKVFDLETSASSAGAFRLASAGFVLSVLASVLFV